MILSHEWGIKRIFYLPNNINVQIKMHAKIERTYDLLLFAEENIEYTVPTT